MAEAPAILFCPNDQAMSETTLDQILSQRVDAHREIVNVDEPTVKLVIFALAGERFAFPGERVREILADAEVFFVPGCPATLEGVINVRGDIESVLRLNEMLHLPASAAEGASTILLCAGGGMKSGVRVEKVIDVVDLPQSSLQAPPANLPDHLRAIVSKVLVFAGQPVAVLDLDKMFTDYARALS